MQNDRPAQPSAGGRLVQARINAGPPGLQVSLGNRITLPGDFRFAAGSDQLAAWREAGHCHRQARDRQRRGPGRLAIAKDGARVAGIPAALRPTGERRHHDTSILVTGGAGTLGRPGPQQRPAAAPHQPVTKGAAVTAGRRY
jgi:hypothetical protein